MDVPCSLANLLGLDIWVTAAMIFFFLSYPKRCPLASVLMRMSLHTSLIISLG